MSSSRRSIPFSELTEGMRVRLDGGDHVTVERIEPAGDGKARVYGRDVRGVHRAPTLDVKGTVTVIDG